MPFNEIEISEYGNQPIELYRFSRGVFSWFYTSYDEDIAFEGNTYSTSSIRRSKLTSSQDLGKSGIKIKMSINTSFVQQYIATSPTDIVTLSITRIHRGDTDSAITWKGRVTNVRFVENEVEVTCQFIYSALRRPGLRRVYQINCPHVLYGPLCKINKSVFSISGNLSAVNGNIITSTSFIVNINPLFDGAWFTGGFVEFSNGGLIDRRFITSHNNNTGALTLNLPFSSNVVVGSPVTAFPGCDRTKSTCNSKFSNILNYGGFPFIPEKNPMDGTPVF